MFCEAAGTTEHMDDKHANQCDKPSWHLHEGTLELQTH